MRNLKQNPNESIYIHNFKPNLGGLPNATLIGTCAYINSRNFAFSLKVKCTKKSSRLGGNRFVCTIR